MRLLYPQRVQDLIFQYGEMKGLRGYTPQSRGQRLNQLVADLLKCWGIDADADVTGTGEVDVAFELSGRHFIMEAKWEAAPTAIGPLAKFQKRLRQRLTGTIGIFLSMGGYSRDALNDLKDGDPLTLVCFQREHLEAMLSGFVPPEELIRNAVSVASRKGWLLIDVPSLIEQKSGARHVELTFGPPPEITALVLDSVPGFQARTLFSLSETGQSGIAILASQWLLITCGEGLYKVNPERHEWSTWLPVPGCARSPMVRPDGSVYLIRRSGVARIDVNRLHTAHCLDFVAGGLAGNVCLMDGDDGTVWTFSNGTESPTGAVNPQVVRIGNELGDQAQWAVKYPPSSAHVAAYLGNERFLVLGVAGLATFSLDGRMEEIVSARHNPLVNPGGITRMAGGRYIIACDDVELWEYEARSRGLRRLAKLDLRGAVYELTSHTTGAGYLRTHYALEDGSLREAVVFWQHGLCEQR